MSVRTVVTSSKIVRHSMLTSMIEAVLRSTLMARFRVEGVDYTPESVELNRNALIELRDAALEASNFDWATLLSHTIAYMADYKEVLEDEQRAGN